MRLVPPKKSLLDLNGESGTPPRSPFSGVKNQGNLKHRRITSPSADGRRRFADLLCVRPGPLRTPETYL
eukprot:6829220-Heterocapsa_arctica.AAC.1